MSRLHPSGIPPQPKPPKWTDVNQFITLWHGTLAEFVPNILQKVDPSRGVRANDFGRGFYTTTYKTQAEEWASKGLLKRRRVEQGYIGQAAVVWFRVPLHELASLYSLAFVRPEPDNELFWSLITHCRSFPDGPPPDPPRYTHRYSHPFGGTCYDMVCGPVAAEWPQKRQSHFRPMVYLGYDQYSFHTDTAAAIFNTVVRTGQQGNAYDWYTL